MTTMTSLERIGDGIEFTLSEKISIPFKSLEWLLKFSEVADKKPFTLSVTDSDLTFGSKVERDFFLRTGILRDHNVLLSEALSADYRLTNKGVLVLEAYKAEVKH